MTHFLRRQPLTIQGLLATALLTAAVAEGQQPRPASGLGVRDSPVELLVSLYNTAKVPAAARDNAAAVASKVVAAAGVDLDWKVCVVPTDCATAADRGQFVVHLLRSRTGARGAAGLVLGHATVDKDAGEGMYARVYVDRVERLAARSKADGAQLLGHAIAHELGHLLLGTTAHSSSGLMRAQWTVADIQRSLIGDWVLTEDEVDAIRRRFR